MSTRCNTPFGVKDKKTGETIPVPCGKCPDCRARRASGWSFRLMEECKHSLSAHFITLTYATNSLPLTNNTFPTLVKRDLQLFFKRLRKAHGKTSPGSSKCDELRVQPNIKYYAVGEYGGKFKRPHYHVVMFNARMELIQPAWQLGQVHYGTVTPASVGYTLKYVSKGGIVPEHKNDDRQREFALMSKDLAAGISLAEWYTGISPILKTECI